MASKGAALPEVLSFIEIRPSRLRLRTILCYLLDLLSAIRKKDTPEKPLSFWRIHSAVAGRRTTVLPAYLSRMRMRVSFCAIAAQSCFALDVKMNDESILYSPYNNWFAGEDDQPWRQGQLQRKLGCAAHGRGCRNSLPDSAQNQTICTDSNLFLLLFLIHNRHHHHHRHSARAHLDSSISNAPIKTVE